MILLLILLIAFSENAFGKTKELKIIGGEYVNGEHYPFMVSLQWYGSHNCGGSIITNNFILTAAHCLYDITSNTINNLKVVVGVTDLNSGDRRVYDAAQTIFPGNYNHEKLIYDIGLVRTSIPIEFNSRVGPIALDTSFINVNTPAMVIGWGKTGNNEGTSIYLKKLYVNVQFTNCNFNNLDVDQQRHIATFKGQDQGTCFGDSGSPLIANGKQIGVFSFMSVPCAIGKCDVFSRVSYYKDWINQYTNFALNL